MRLAHGEASRRGQDAVTAANLHKGCSETSLLATGMLNWTKLAFLAQYHTICDEPELIRLQMHYFGRKLVFEHFPGSTASQPVCSLGSSHGGHVVFDEILKVSRTILEHDFLKYHHLKASLHPEDFFETRFWNHINPDRWWGDPEAVKKVIGIKIAGLESSYNEFSMFGFRENSNVVQLQSVEFTFLILFVWMLTISMGFVLSIYCTSRSRR